MLKKQSWTAALLPASTHSVARNFPSKNDAFVGKIAEAPEATNLRMSSDVDPRHVSRIETPQ